jgi:eukaryotic-like serine/threonine-protein kinase
MDSYATVIRSLHEMGLLDASQRDELISVPDTIDHNLGSTVSMIQSRGWITEFQAEAVTSGSMKDLVLGPYALIKILGRGGMGVVYKAKHQESGQLVAIKVVKDEVAADPQRLGRFREEAQILQSLRHPNIVEVVEIGEWKGQPYLVMELLEGGSLDGWNGGEPGDWTRIAATVETLARTIHVVHSQQIIHRDLKPANILFNEEGVLKVTDFGLAKLLDSEARFTRTGDVLGTPAYMAPEQAAGRSKLVGPATDVHSIGVILYELLTGKRPFGGSSTLEVLEAVRTIEPVVPSMYRSALPKSLETICLKCLEKEPVHRYATAEALAEDLNRFLGDGRVLARRAGVARKASRWRRLNPARSTLLISGLALSLAAFAAGTWYYDAYRRPKVSYFRDYISHLGVPEGRSVIDQAEVGRRAYSYKITSRGGRVEQLEVVDGLGHLTTWSGESPTLGRVPEGTVNRECRYTYQRKADGSLDRELAFDRFGNQLWALQYNNSATANYLNILGYSSPRASSGATYLGFVWSPEGYAQEIHYLNKVGSALPNDEGVYGIRNEVDKQGRVLSRTFLNSKYQPEFNRTARYTRIEHIYGDDGLLRERRLLDSEGRPVIGKNGYSIERMTRDPHGNVIEASVFDTQGQPAFFKSVLAHMIRTEHDARGFPTGSSYFDASGRPSVTKGGYARNTRAWDEAGNLIDEQAFDIAGHLALNSDGFARIRTRFDTRNRPVEVTYTDASGAPAIYNGHSRAVEVLDDRGNYLEESYFDAQGQPTTATGGYARIVKTFDERNNQLTALYFNTEGRPTTIKEGYAGLRHKYDDSDNRISTEYLNAEGKPTYGEKGYARSEMAYDDQGRRLSQFYYAPDGSPAVEKMTAVHGLRTNYDAKGNPAEITTLGTDQRPIASKMGFALMKMAYDDRGLLVDSRLFDVDARPVAGSSGFARKTTSYDDRGNKVDEAYFDPKGRPAAPSPEGAHRTIIKYDDRGNPTELSIFGVDGKPGYHQQEGFSRLVVKTTYSERLVHDSVIYDADGKPAIAKNGYQRTVVVNDLRDRELERSYFDASGRPMANKEGFSRSVNEYDSRGNLIRQAFFDADGKPVFVNSLGCARAEKRFDERGNNTEEAYFGTDGRPIIMKKYGVAKVVNAFDSLNRKVELRNYGLDGKPMMSDERAARATYRYDDRGNTTEVAFFDTEDRPTLSIRQCARIVQAFDEQNNVVEMRYYGRDGKLIRDGLGIAMYRYERDPMGRLTAEYFFGPDEKPTASKPGPWRITYLRDEAGNVIEEAYLDAEGKPTRGEAGVSKQVRRYDRQGNQIDNQFFDIAGKPMADGSGVSRRTGIYDPRGNVLEQSRFDAEGNPVSDRTDGAARMAYRYDERGQTIEIAAFGVDGRPCRMAKLGVALVRSTYDARGNPHSFSMFDEEGKPAMSPLGAARVEWVYDPMGRRIEEASFDTEGKPTISIEGCARVTNRFGPRGYAEEVRYYGVDGKPGMVPDGYSARLVSISPDFSRREQTYLGLEDKPVIATMGYARIVEEFVPATSEIAAESYFGPDGQPVLGKKGYARLVKTFDDRKRLVGESFFGIDGQPILGKDGTSGYLNRLDDAGRQVERTFFGKDGRPGPNAEGVTRIVTIRDESGREVGVRNLGPNGASILSKNGWSGYDREYTTAGAIASDTMLGLDGVRLVKIIVDAQMKPTRRVFYRHPTIKPSPTHYTSLAPVVVETLNLPGPSTGVALFESEGGSPLIHADGYHSLRNYLDSKGRTIATANYGVDGQPVLNKDGYASVIYKLDDRGRRMIQTNFGLDEKPIANRLGFVTYKMAYDTEGRLTEESFLDAEGKPVAHKELLYSRGTTVFDTRGNAVKVEYFGTDGRPIEGVQGFARVERSYDEKGFILKASYFDAAGHGHYTLVTVDSLIAGGAGEKLGIKAGDVLIEYAGRKVDFVSNFLLARRLEPVNGPSQTCRVLRDNKELTFQFSPGIIGMVLMDRVERKPQTK